MCWWIGHVQVYLYLIIFDGHGLESPWDKVTCLTASGLYDVHTCSADLELQAAVPSYFQLANKICFRHNNLLSTTWLWLPKLEYWPKHHFWIYSIICDWFSANFCSAKFVNLQVVFFFTKQTSMILGPFVSIEKLNVLPCCPCRNNLSATNLKTEFRASLWTIKKQKRHDLFSSLTDILYNLV